MFDNIGGKIKGLAVLWTTLGIIGAVIYAIVTLSLLSDYAGFAETITVLLAAAFFGVISWVSSFLLYGFGELIDQITSVNSKAYEISRLLQRSLPADKVPTPPPAPRRVPYTSTMTPTATGAAGSWTCRNCGSHNNSASRFCKDCGAYK